MAVKHLYHAPSECPVCGDTLITTRKGCLHCGTEIAGEFASCEFCNLNQADLDLLKVFLASRGNLREVEKHLQVSYPTARARLDAVLARLGLDGDPQAAEPTRSAPEEEPVGEEASEYGDEVTADPGSVEDQILARVARGELSAEDAARLLS
ncbi:hypothetical protein SAMN02745244_01373 [Tessaracoccus bendigoensis DSM 12906]|uniref:DUF2089 domain-containing protein n=1 Tax=Tessaracoccus bendigoensis DSM 12906 TaxID=1123357 RepID=A0A1M6F7W0_9ACTN|nr:DUF2089 domain-containing protein [Tessaracoccus bendigoensis]SHI93752.1 hypothetical protein SAMN02745244_01373 [Tessaracoccus bendigoensis DSM 12906]